MPSYIIVKIIDFKSQILSSVYGSSRFLIIGQIYTATGINKYTSKNRTNDRLAHCVRLCVRDAMANVTIGVKRESKSNIAICDTLHFQFQSQEVCHPFHIMISLIRQLLWPR